MLASKRALTEQAEPAKRQRSVAEVARLCDLRGSLTDLFSNKTNSSRARERGYLRSRDASGKYEEFEKKLFALYKDSGTLEMYDEDWVLEIMPELKSLEADTLDTLLDQAEQHTRYERAARELVMLELAKAGEVHQREMRQLRQACESEATRSTVGAEMRIKALDEQARDEQEQLRSEAENKICELEETIASLEAEIEELKTKTDDERRQLEEAHEAEIESLKEECESLRAAFEDAQSETELKRETSRKLKEEIIDNDRLTVANLNRIKHLETELDEFKDHCIKLDKENDELREELSKTIQDENQSSELQEELKTLREVLAERETQLISLSHKLNESLGSSPAAIGSQRFSERRESLLDKFGLGLTHKPASSSIC